MPDSKLEQLQVILAQVELCNLPCQRGCYTLRSVPLQGLLGMPVWQDTSICVTAPLPV